MKTFFVPGILLLAFLVPEHGQGAPGGQRLKPEDLFELEYAADPQVSPDGASIVYVRNFSDIMTDKRYANLWWIRADGSEQRPLTTGAFNDTSPRWSPDGKQLLFVSNRDGKPQVHRLWL